MRLTQALSDDIRQALLAKLDSWIAERERLMARIEQRIKDG